MVSYAADDPMNMIGTLHGVGRKLQEAGRVSEAFDAFAKTARLARDQLIRERHISTSLRGWLNQPS